MDLFVDDDGFVRAPALQVYRCLTNVAAWDRWWPGVSADTVDVSELRSEELRELLDTAEDAEAWRLTWRDRWPRRLRFEAVVHGWRHEAGFQLQLSGDVDGRAEFWLEQDHGGIVVHHVLVGSTHRRRAVRVLTSYRRVLRRGLWGLKDHLQSEVREDLGLAP